MVKKRRRTSAAAFVLTIVFWMSFVYLVLKIPPESTPVIAGFFINLFLLLFFTLSFLFENRRRSFLISLTAVFILLLRFFKMDNYLNIILLLALLVTMEVYYRGR